MEEPIGSRLFKLLDKIAQLSSDEDKTAAINDFCNNSSEPSQAFSLAEYMIDAVFSEGNSLNFRIPHVTGKDKRPTDFHFFQDYVHPRRELFQRKLSSNKALNIMVPLLEALNQEDSNWMVKFINKETDYGLTKQSVKPVFPGIFESEFSPLVHFYPWIGPAYERMGFMGKGKKLLLLGESHYLKKDDEGNNNITRKIIHAHSFGDKYRFFTIIGGLLNFENANHFSVEYKLSLWHSVAFYNYIQQSVGTGPRISPTPEMWQQAEKPFLEVTDKLKPDGILIFGKRLSAYVNKIQGISRYKILSLTHPCGRIGPLYKRRSEVKYFIDSL